MLDHSFLQKLSPVHIEVLGFWQLNLYDHDIRSLYKDLESWLHQRFGDGSPVFQAHERLVFLHDDTDFWMESDGVPITLYNLQLILRDLDISNAFCRIITNMPRYQVFADRVASALTNDTAIKCVDGNLVGGCYLEFPKNYRPDKIYSQEIDQIQAANQNIKWPFMLASRLRRPHRSLFVSQLLENGLGDRGLISYHAIKGQAQFSGSAHSQDLDSVKANLVMINQSPRQNHTLIVDDPGLGAAMTDLDANGGYHWPKAAELPSWLLATHWTHPEIQQGFIYVALETAATLPRPFVSRITMKAIVNWRPFVIFGCQGTLAFLKELGFQTFGDFWNEDYDLEPDPVRRCQMIIEILGSWAHLGPADLASRYHDMTQIIQHNQTHYCTEFGKAQLHKLREGLR